MAIITFTVGTTGRDYSTWNAAAAALPADLVSDGNSYILSGYNDSEFVSSSTLLTLSGHTTDTTHTITVTAAAGESFADNSGNELNYNVSNGVGLRNTPGSGAVIYVSDNYVQVKRLQFQNEDTGGGGNCFVGGGDGLLINSCILRSVYGGTAYIPPATSVYPICSNTTFIQSGAISGFIGPSIFPYGVILKFCNVVYPSDFGTGANPAIWDGFIVDNCAIFNYTTVTNPNSTFTTCMTDVASPPTGCTTVVYGDQFEDTTSSTGNWRVKTGADLIGAGTYDGSYPVDVFGTTRADPPTIGAMEFAAAAAPNFVLDELIDPVTGTRQTKVLVQTSLNDLVNNLSTNLQTKVIDNLSLNKTIDNVTLNALSDVDIGLSLNKLIGLPTEWSTLRKGSGITVSGSDNLTATRSAASVWHSIYSTTNHLTGKFYVKFTANTVDSIDGFVVGIGNASGPTTNYLGSNANSAGLQSNGGQLGFSSGVSQGSWVSGDELLLAFDFDNKQVYLRRNGSWIGNPSLGTGFAGWSFSGPYFFGWSGFGFSVADKTTASLTYDSDPELVDFKSWDDLTDFKSTVLVQTQLNSLISNLSTNLQSQVLLQTSLNNLIDNLSTNLQTKVLIQAALNQILGPVVLAGILNAAENLVLNSLIDEIDLNANSSVLVNINLNKTIDAIVSSASTTVTLNINVNQTLENLTLSSTLQLVGEDRNLVLNALVDNLDLDSTVQVIINAALNSLINNIASTTDADVIDNLSLVQTIDNLTLNATVATTTGFVLNESIGDITLNAIAKVIENLSLNQSIGLILSNLQSTVEDHLSLNQTIDNLVLNASTVTTTGFVLNQTINNITASAAVKVIENLNLNQSVGTITSNLQSTAEDHLNLNKTLDNLTLTATATQGTTSNALLSATIDNLTSAATLTTVAIVSNIVVNSTIDNLTLVARANRRSGAGDNVAWWWRQYVARHAQEKLLEREITGNIISPIGIIKGEIIGVKKEKSKVVPEAIIFRGLFVSEIGNINAEIDCGYSASGSVVLRNAKIKSEAFIGNALEISESIILPMPLVSGKGGSLRAISGNIKSEIISGYGSAGTGYSIEAKLESTLPLIRGECQIGIFGTSNVLNSDFLNIESEISHGIDGNGKFISPSVFIDSKVFIGITGESNLIKSKRIIIDTQIVNGSVSEKIQIDSPIGFIKKLNSINGGCGSLNIISLPPIIQSKIIVGINDEIKINMPIGQIKGKAELGKILVLVEDSNVIMPLAFINVNAEHDPDDEDSLTAILLLAA